MTRRVGRPTKAEARAKAEAREDLKNADRRIEEIRIKQGHLKGNFDEPHDPRIDM